MEIYTSGRPEKVSISTVKKAARYFGSLLLSKRMYSSITVNLEFSDEDLSYTEDASCTWNDTNHRSKDFTVCIRPTLGKRKTLIALAHEMVHVKQFATGELKDYMASDNIKWKGVKFKAKYDHTIEYWSEPWEIEAHGRELGLYNMYQTFIGNK